MNCIICGVYNSKKKKAFSCKGYCTKIKGFAKSIVVKMMIIGQNKQVISKKIDRLCDYIFTYAYEKINDSDFWDDLQAKIIEKEMLKKS